MTVSYIYVVECADKSFYTGYTIDIVRRIKLHNAKKGAKYTRARGPVTLVYFEEYETKSEATKAESSFKKLTRMQKEQYIFENISKEKENKIRYYNKKIKED
ncbi:GIY-YIG nuclease family protein [Gemella morbillorum]|uniref:GIY-YIG nuclease family protein n=1 Tax=Gemella morbillorum TaxID=29391 RepID=UPI00248E6CB8|nr:GIY-YIG nuclease family protein [Gemella morbillorum]